MFCMRCLLFQLDFKYGKKAKNNFKVLWLSKNFCTIACSFFRQAPSIL